MYKQIDSNKRKSFLLIIVSFLVIVGLGWAWGYYYGEGGYFITILAAIFAMLMSLVSFYAGDKIALAQSGAKEISKDDNPHVWRLVENLCITAGIPMPKIHIIHDPAMNAFATGRTPDKSSIALTTGLIQNLKNEELEGVIAHELSHIKNYDIRLMMVVIICVGVITLMADWLLRSFIWRSRGSNRNAQGITMIIGVVLAVLSPLFAKLIQLAVSRKREFLADASGALLTRYPEGLASALEKISSQSQPLRRANKATAHLYISNPFKKKNASRFFSTHPPAEERIKALRTM